VSQKYINKTVMDIENTFVPMIAKMTSINKQIANNIQIRIFNDSKRFGI